MKNSPTPVVQPPTPIVKSNLLNKEGVATHLGVSVRTLDNLVSGGEFPPGVRIGRFLYWTDGAIAAWHQRVFAVQLGWRP